MKNIIAFCLLLTLSSYSFVAVPAFFTGKFVHITTATGKPGIKCQYQYNGNKYVWAVFVGGVCPSTIEVE